VTADLPALAFSLQTLPFAMQRFHRGSPGFQTYHRSFRFQTVTFSPLFTAPYSAKGFREPIGHLECLVMFTRQAGIRPYHYLAIRSHG
jgi:hypothetical protein